MRKSKKAFLGIIIFAAWIILIIAAFLMSRNHSLKKPDYSHLMPVRPEVTDADNAYICFSNAAQMIVLTNDFKEVMLEFRQGKSFETNKIEQVLADNAHVFALIEDGVKCTVCLEPVYDLSDPGSFNISEQVELANLLATKVKYERLTGDYSNAVESSKLLLAYAGMRCRYPNSIVSYLAGCGVLGISLGHTSALIHDVGTSESQLLKLSESLDGVVDIRESLAFAAKSEFALLRQHISTVYTVSYAGLNLPKIAFNNKFSGYFFDRDETIDMVADVMTQVVANATLFHSDMTLFEEIYDPHNDSLLDTLRPNSIGRALGQICLPSVKSCCESTCRLELQVCAIRLVAALKRFRMKNGILPERLDQLVPEYMDAIPLDPYDGNPLRYDPDKIVGFNWERDNYCYYSVALTGVVYSVGENLVDDGGSTQIRPDSNKTRIYWRSDGEDLVYGIDEREKTEWAEEKETSNPGRRRRR